MLQRFGVLRPGQRVLGRASVTVKKVISGWTPGNGAYRQGQGSKASSAGTAAVQAESTVMVLERTGE